MHTTPALLVAALLSTTVAAQEDAAPGLLKARAERTVEGSSSGQRAAGTGNVLFTMVGADNSSCVRPLPDVNGDLLDEVLVGIDKSGTPNVFGVSGASTGSATSLWSLQTNGGLSGGSPYGDQSLVPIGDTNGNGSADLLLGTAGGGRTAYALDGASGAEIWRFDTYVTGLAGWVYSLCQVDDVTGDGVPECAFGVGSTTDAVYLVDGAPSTGQAAVRWRFPAGDAVYSVRNIGDANGDGKADVLAALGDNVDELVCLSGGTSEPTGSVIWRHDPGVSVYACEVLPDVNGDGVNEALAALWTLTGSAVRCLDGATGNQLWASTQIPQYAQALSVLADVTGDGLPEVIVSSWENAVNVLNGATGTLVWKTKVGTKNGGDVWTARAIDDLNGDGREDVVAGSFDGKVYAMDGDSGEVFWGYDTGNRVFSVHAVGDLNGDGRPEVAAGTQDTASNTVVYVLEGDAGIPFPGLTLSGNGEIGTTVGIEVTGSAGAIAQPAFSVASTSVQLPPFGGTLELLPPLTLLPPAIVPSGGAAFVTAMIPAQVNLIGTRIHVQALALFLGPLRGDFTDSETFVIQ